AASIVRVTDPLLRTQFRQISNNMDNATYQKALNGGQAQSLGHAYIESCAEFLVFCMDSHRHSQLVPDAQLDWAEVTLIGAIDAALLAQNIMVAAESLGLGGVYIGSLRNDIERAGTLLNLPKHVVPLFGMCLGHPIRRESNEEAVEASKAKQRPRLPMSVLVSENQYQPASEEVLADYNEQVKQYYHERSNKDMDWRQQIQATFAKPVRPYILPYLQQQGFVKR
ncbi:MAG: oxygen-insensitive NADPH nitroreductase, partial [Psychrobacter sp.]|nr:oxygen-insensitive NADPH nitroreductase [Psychrobacter sp.]